MEKKLNNKNRLSIACPELVKEWNDSRNGKLTPDDVAHKSNKKVWWVCKKGHEWQATILNRAYGRNCPYCSGKKVCKDNCLATINPKLAKEWHPIKNKKITSNDVTCGSGKKVWWICKKGHEWQAIVANRSKGYQCSYCTNRKICKDNCLGTLNSELTKEWHYFKNKKLTPNDVTCGSDKVVWWICKKGHEWQARVCDRHKDEKQCFLCQSLAFLYPKSQKLWHTTKNKNLTSENVTPCSHKIVWWKCKKGHEWQEKIESWTNRINNCFLNNNCLICHKLEKMRKCLAVSNPELLKEWHSTKNKNLSPDNFSCKSGKIIWWECIKCKHEWRATIQCRNRGDKCPCCGNKVMLKNGAQCDSIIEAFYHIKFTKNKLNFKHNRKYNKEVMGNQRYDFYFPDSNTYVEVTSFDKRWPKWDIYIKKIKTKKRLVEKRLKANFQFIQRQLTDKEIKLVQKNSQQQII